MGLLADQKAERRARILASARQLIAERGFDGLTMRELAAASRVSVPTLYNLFGGKLALLLGELEETFARVDTSMRAARGEGFVERMLAGCEAANDDLLSVPRYSRALIHRTLTSAETEPMRRDIGRRFVTIMAEVLRDAQATGEIADFVDAGAVAARAYAHYVATMIQWAMGDLDDAEFRNATLLGPCLMFLGIARGRAARDLEERVRELQQALVCPRARPRRRRDG
jgi:AcrR family transcriptional regulator